MIGKPVHEQMNNLNSENKRSMGTIYSTICIHTLRSIFQRASNRFDGQGFDLLFGIGNPVYRQVREGFER